MGIQSILDDLCHTLRDDTEDCQCSICQTTNGIEALKKKFARQEGMFHAILSKLGLDEHRDFVNVHFSFADDNDCGALRHVLRDGEDHYVINVNTGLIIESHYRSSRKDSHPDRDQHGQTRALHDLYDSTIHELQHLKQIREGRLSKKILREDNGGRYCIWEGQRHDLKYLEKRDKAAHEVYLQLPWEVEAREVAKRIVDELIAEGRLPDRPPEIIPRQDSQNDDIISHLVKALGDLGGAKAAQVAKLKAPKLREGVVFKGVAIGPDGPVEVPKEVSSTVLAMLSAAGLIPKDAFESETP